MRKPAIIALLALGGCATPAWQSPAVTIPPAYREGLAGAPAPLPATGIPAPAGEAAPAGLFWRALNDTTLDRLVALALRDNLDVHAAQARIRGARASRFEATLDLAPTITAAGGYARQRLSSAGFAFGSGSFPDTDIWDAGFDASWELDLFGRIRRQVQARGALEEAAVASLREVQVSLTAEMARTYFELRGAQEQLAVARRNADNQRRSLELTRERLDAGRGTALDVERALAQLELTLASIPAFETRVAAAEYRIGVLTGRPPLELAGALEGEGEIPTLPAVVPTETPEALLSRRPDIAAAERRAAAGRALVSAAKADYLPRFSVGGSAGLTSTSLGSLGDDGTFRYVIGPTVSWPAFNLGRVKARVDVTRAVEAESRAQYHQAVLQALEEAESAQSRYRTSRARVERIRSAAEASGRAAELARLRFTEGVSDFLQVLDAERTQLDAESQLVLARTEAAVAYAALFKALGGP